MGQSVKARAGTTGWRRTVLAASLVLNLFLAAVVVGHLLRADIDARGGATLLARGIAQAMSSLSTRDAAAFTAALRQDAPQYREAAKQLAEARLNLEHQITADRFDPAAVQAALAAWQAKWNRFMDGFGPTLVDALGQISPAGRQNLVAERRQANPGPRLP